MVKQTKLLVVIAIALITVMLGVLNVAYAQPADADVFAVIKLNNPGAFIADIGQFAEKIQPGMSAMVNDVMVGQMLFQNPAWAGLDKAGVYTAVILNPMTNPQSPFAVIMPVTNKDAYLQALTQSGLTDGGEANGIHTFTPPNQKPILLAFTGKVGIFAQDQNVATKVKAMVDGNDPILKEAPVVKGALTANIAMSKVMVAVRPMLEMFKQQALMGMEQKMQQAEGAAAPVQPEAMKNLVQAEIDMFLSLLDQTDKLQLGLDIKPDGLRITKAVFAVAGGNVAKFMAAQTPKKSALLGLIPADSGLIMSGSINFTPEFKNWYIAFTKAISALGQPADAALVDKLTQWVSSSLDAFGGDFVAGGLSQTTEALFTEIFTVKDATKAKELVGQYPDLFKSMVSMYQTKGLNLDMKLAGQEQYKGGDILNFDLGLKAASIPDPEGQEVFTKIFGDTLAVPIGFIKNYAVIGVGKTAREQVQKTMDTLNSGAAAQMTPAKFGLPDANNFFMYISVPKIMKWVAQYAPNVPAFELQDSPGIAMSGQFVKSHFEGELVIPTAEILTLKSIGEQAKKGAPGAAEAPIEEETPTEENTGETGE